MKNKQIAGMVIAGLVFVFVCSMSLLTNSISKNMFKEEDLIKTFSEAADTFDLPTEDFIGVVDVQGVIMNATTTSMFETLAYDHQRTLDYIDTLMDADNNKGIFLTVNSPGGGVYESDELYLKLMEYKEKTGRPVWAYMETEACSGGYYISMAADKVIANRNTWTGSIGVIMNLTNYKGLYDKLGVKSVIIASGKNKAMGSPTIDMTQEQKDILQSLVDEAYGQFVGIVSKGRKMDEATVRPIADGRIYSAQQALELKLIDQISGYEEASKAFQDETKASTLYTPKSNAFDFSTLFGAAQSFKAKSDAEVVADLLKSQGSGVPMYYAYPGQN